MSRTQPKAPTYSGLLSQAARLLREARLLTMRQLAAAMGMERRTYHTFETGGGGSTSLERIRRFATAVNADEHAIWAAIMIGSPAFALRAADNKLMSAFLICLREFDEAAGDDLARIDTVTLVSTFERTFEALLQDARRRALLQTSLSDSLVPPPDTEPPLDPTVP